MIREATLNDLDRLVELGTHMHAESRYSIFDFDPVKLRRYIQTFIEHDHGMIFVCEKNEVIVGGVMGWIEEQYFGHDKLLCDLALFVEPDKRGAMAGALLIKRFLEYGKEQGVAQIILTNSSGVDKERVAQLYAKLGMEHVGFVFSYNNKKA